jgi:hypothetical protein
MRPAKKKFRKVLGQEKTGTIADPGLVLAGCPDKVVWCSFQF